MDRWDEFSERLRDVETREVHFAGSGDPNGVVSAAMGSQYWDHVNDDLWVNDDGASSWELVGGAGGITGAGLANQVAYFTAPNVIAGDAGMTYVAGTDTLTVGNVIIATGGNVLPADAAGQDLGDATHRWDAFASYVDLPDGGWIGNSAATARLGFDSSGTTGYAYVLGANLGVGTDSPDNLLTLYQSADNDGLKIYGYDDESTQYLHLYIDGTDKATIYSNQHIDFYTWGSRALLLTNTNVSFYRRPKLIDGQLFTFGNDEDFGMGFLHTDDTFRIVAGDHLVSDPTRIAIDINGLIGINETGPDRRLHARETSASTDVIIPVVRFESEVSGGVGAVGHGAGVEFYGESSTTTNQPMGLIAARWSVATHASRRSRLEFRTWYIGNEVLVGVVEAPAGVGAGGDGNARGVGAVDWQGYRGAATQVASNYYSVIGGGSENTASGSNATVPGGYSCLASGDFTFATGYDAHATHAHSFVLSATGAQTLSWGTNTWTVRCHGGARFYSAAGVGMGVQLTAGGNAWAGISDRNAKRNLHPMTDVLTRLADVPMYWYELKAQPEGIVHIGPVSQEFNPAFGFTEDPIRINTMDAIGVSLAGVKALHAEALVLRQRVRVLEAQLVD